MQVQIDLYNPPNPHPAEAIAAAPHSRQRPPCRWSRPQRRLLRGPRLRRGPRAVRGATGASGSSPSARSYYSTAAGRLEAEQPRLLETNMYGSLTLTLQHFGARAAFLPSGAVFSHGDRTYIFKVVNGKAKRVAVRVQYDNGTVAKVVQLEPAPAPRPGRTASDRGEGPGQGRRDRPGEPGRRQGPARSGPRRSPGLGRSRRSAGEASRERRRPGTASATALWSLMLPGSADSRTTDAWRRPGWHGTKRIVGG